MKKLLFIFLMGLSGCSKVKESWNSSTIQSQEETIKKNEDAITSMESDADRRTLLIEDMIKRNDELMKKALALKASYMHTRDSLCALDAKKCEKEIESLGVRYMVELEVKKSTASLSITQAVKDNMNKFSFSVPVDRQFYEGVNVGDVMANGEQLAGLIFGGSTGNIKITVIEKHMK